MEHAPLSLALLLAGHLLQLKGPLFLELDHFSRCHENASRKSQRVILEEVMVLQTHLSVELGELGNVQSQTHQRNIVKGLVVAEHHSLREEERQEVEWRNQVEFPVEGLEDGLFKLDEVVILEGRLDQRVQLLHSWVGLLEEFCADQHADYGAELDYLGEGPAFAELQSSQSLHDGVLAEEGVEDCNAVVDGLRAELEVFPHLAHPVNHNSSFLNVLGCWVENLV